MTEPTILAQSGGMSPKVPALPRQPVPSPSAPGDGHSTGSESRAVEPEEPTTIHFGRRGAVEEGRGLSWEYALVLLTYVLWKLLLIYVMQVANAGLDGTQNEWNRYVIKDNSFWGAPFANWDAQHYLLLAQQGYAGALEDSRAFYPLFPLLTWMLKPITISYFWAGFVTSTAFGMAFVVLFYALLRRVVHDAEKSLVGVMLLLSYPSAFYLTTLYSESVVLFLLVGLFYFYAIKRSRGSVAFSFLLPWAKGQGVLVGAFLFADLLVGLARRRKRETGLAVLNLLAMGVGLASLTLFYKVATGNPLAQIDAQQHFVFHLSVTNILSPSHFLKYFFSPSQEWFDYNNSLMDKLFIGLVLVCSVPVAFAKDRQVTTLYLVLALTTAMMGEGGSFIRHSLLLWPFIILSVVRNHQVSRVRACSLALLFLILQLFFASRFATNQWVG